MARRRRTKTGLPTRQKKLTPDEKKRFDLSSRAHSGHINAKRYGFTTKFQGKSESCVFYARFAAHKYLEMMIADQEFDWKSDNELITHDGMRIKGIDLRLTYDYKLKRDEEKHFELSEEYLKRALSMRLGGPAPAFVEGDSQPRRRRSRKHMIKMDTVAEQLGMTPRACRGALRRLNIDKPEHGWAWETQAEVDKIKSLITGKTTITVDFTNVKEPTE